MMRSMYAGVAGLKAFQTKMDVIGNNIANVNTIGYKAQRVTFSDVFSETLQNATGAVSDTGQGGQNAMQIGLGVDISSIDMLMTQGATQRTDNPFDLMINGEGFIVVGNGTEKYFTRNGAIKLDQDNNLCLANGLVVNGWKTEQVDGETVIKKGAVEPLNLGENQTSAARPTTEISLSGNFDASLADGESAETSIRFYDSLGNYFTAIVDLTKTVTPDGSIYTPTVSKIVDEDGRQLLNAKGETIKPVIEISNSNTANVLEFDKNGQLKKDLTDQPLNLSLKFEKTGTDKWLLATDQEFKNAGTDEKELDKLSYSGLISTLEAECDGLTQYKSKQTIESRPIDGNKAGTLAGYSIGGDGIIIGTYTNGDKKKLAQIPIAQFDNPAGLEKVGDNLFATTANSGDFDSIGTNGNFQSGCLEMSNVDLSREFTEMITAQRAFQANSRIITVSDEMLQELSNLKR